MAGLAYHAAYELLAMAIAVGQRRVDEVDAQFDGAP